MFELIEVTLLISSCGGFAAMGIVAVAAFALLSRAFR